MEPSKPPQRVRPFLELLLRSTVAFPVYFVLMVIWLGAACAMVMLPLMGLFFGFYMGDWRSGILYLVGGASAFWIWRLLHQMMWENPDSLL